MKLTRIKLKNFTAFKTFDTKLAPGVNIFIGANGTGKTHILKIAYCACQMSNPGAGSFSSKLVGAFLPYEERLGRLAHRTTVSTTAVAEVFRGDRKLRLTFSNHAKTGSSAKISGKDAWAERPIECAYVPVKEMLANAPGFRSLFALRELHFEQIYADIIDLAFRPILRGPHHPNRKKLLDLLQEAIDGKVVAKKETFFLKNRGRELEFSLLAEGMRKLGLLWLLIQNGTLLDGSVLFWDEPETNLNPRIIGTLVEVLLELQRLGVQILLATHDYVVLKEFDLRSKATDKVQFHALYRDESGVIQHSATDDYLQIHPNAIADTFLELYDRDVKRDLE
jgi:energy-coupling factor transporter ATP-binding protein EcfA2